MSKQESNKFENEIKEITVKRKTVFCPIINAMCRTDCEAFEMPSVKVARDSPVNGESLAHGYISGGGCMHFLLRKRDRVEVDYEW